MDSRHGKVRLKVEGDRLSNLPNDLIHKILSFIDVKYAIRTSALSSRWRYIWTSMPCLNFSSEGFHSLPEFSKFVTRVLSTRNNKTEVHYVKLAFCGKASEAFVKRILKYAFSHNVQQLDGTCLPGKKGYHEDLCESPLSVFSSQSLKSLTMSGYGYRHYVKIPPTWYLPALTTLNLFCVALHADDTTDKCAGLLSNCANLKNLTLNNCRIPGGRSKDLHLCHLGLSNLTLEDGGYNAVYVDTPQLKKFTIINFPEIHLVSAPNLASLRYKDDTNNYYGNPLKVSSDLLHLEKVDICIQCSHECEDYAQDIVHLLQQLRSVKFLKLNLELLKLLFSSLELILDQPSPFTDLKSLKIYPADITKPEVTMSTEVKNFLLDSPHGATFTPVSYEVRAVRNVASAENLMRKLQVLLDKWTENSEINTTDMEQDKAPMESQTATMHEQVEVENERAFPDTKIKWHFGDRMTHIESYWEGLNEQYEKGYENTGHTISMLREIKVILTKLPASHRDKLEGRFSGLCVEAETIMDNVMDCMKIKCGKTPHRSNVSSHELVTSPQRSS
ncbi:putative F-box domain, leucine-rich repeat domain superfamily, F-box-like domain superfamily [Helianthus annuus]|nr:putative F-box domain, leucine-rich repeat domain superfamily, F-box-like domain superfamily [Helianthus annuus]KAJ0824543.1 putative F-box domain, leucine-rich repeat domain superfamily, F-box-like domain superfamily [Helianthus annuus]